MSIIIRYFCIALFAIAISDSATIAQTKSETSVKSDTKTITLAPATVQPMVSSPYVRKLPFSKMPTAAITGSPISESELVKLRTSRFKQTSNKLNAAQAASSTSSVKTIIAKPVISTNQ